ncbi:Lpd Pyruvate/2-oxoglutarate dehydrogenase complex, dihydrolipoamide dehydrogenase (E3) component, and related enzymes [Acidimicrobiia bacterium]
MAENFDVVIIGGGPAGYAAALYGASAGLNIALIEKSKVGGTCLHVGCVPAKELLETAAVRRAIVGSSMFGLTTSEPILDFTVTQARKQEVIDGLFGGLSGLLKRRKVTMFDGIGTLHAGHVVKISGGASGDVEVTGTHVILASGSVPRTIPGFEVDGNRVITSDELLSLQELPKSAVVIGGGAIGCEFASMMSDLGTEVTILEALPKILPGCDDDITKIVLKSFKDRGINVRTGVSVNGHEPRKSGGTTVKFGDGETIEVDTVVVSVGRRPLSENLGLEGTAVQVSERGHVVVDPWCRTGEPGVYAAGDLIATPALAHIGFAEGILVIQDILGEDPIPVDYGNVPWCIYCHPEVSFVGHSEASAKEAGIEIVVSKHRYSGNGRALILGEPEGMVKVIAEKRPDGTAGRLIGVHMVGPWVTEQLGQAYLAVNWEATADDVAKFIQPHPTLSELFGESVLALTGRSLHG